MRTCATLLALALLCASGPASAVAAPKVTFADSRWCSKLEGQTRDEVRAKLPPLTGRVVDGANLLPPAAERELTQRLAELERRTSDQLIVVNLESLGGCTIDQAALRLGNGWGVGQRGKDNGVLLVTAPVERKVRIELGFGLARRLPDEQAVRIIDQEILPRFRQGDMVQGIIGGVDAIVAALDPALARDSVSK